MLIKLHTFAELIYLTGRVEKINTVQKTVSFKQRVFFDRIVLAGIYLAGITAAVLMS